jgi:hypothetical protein
MISNDINNAWATIVPLLRKFEFVAVQDIVGLTGFDRQTLLRLGIDQDRWNNESTSVELLVKQIEEHYLKFAEDEKLRFLNIVIEEILSGNHKLQGNFSHEKRDLKKKLEYYLERLGWQLIDNKVLAIVVLDQSDLKELNPSARDDLIKAATKFRDGDLSGAISSACAAVDSVTARVYQDNNLGDSSNSQSFQEKCNKSLKAIGVFEAIDRQLIEIKWKESDIKQFKENLKGTVSQAALVMQKLRSDMSDAHGTKPVIKPLVFDSIKWSQIIVRLLSEKYDN